MTASPPHGAPSPGAATRAAGLLDLRGLADFHAVHYDTARKGWRGWVRTRGHPAPLNGVRPYRWLLASCEAWRRRAEADGALAVMADEAANDRTGPAAGAAPDPRRAARDRARIAAMMTRGAASC